MTAHVLSSGLRASTALVGLAFALAASLCPSRVRADEGPGPAPPPRATTRFTATTSLGWLHTSAFGASMNLADVQFGIGFARIVPKGMGFDLVGLLGMQGGRTEAGRFLAGFDTGGVAATFHFDMLRAGVGARVGILSAQRASESGAQTYVLTDAFLAFGVEPFAVDERPVFFEAKAHVLGWDGKPLIGFSIDAGVRFCGPACAK